MKRFRFNFRSPQTIQDGLFVAYMAALQPYFFARVSLPNLYPQHYFSFLIVALVLILLDPFVMYRYLRHQLWRLREEGKREDRSYFLAVLCLFRMMAGLFPIMLLMKDKQLPTWVMATVAFIWGMAQLFYMALFFSKDYWGIKPKQLPKRALRRVEALLFLSMCAICTLSLGSLQFDRVNIAEMIFHDTGNLIAFFLLLFMLYWPARLYEFMDEAIVSRYGREKWQYRGRLLLMLIAVGVSLQYQRLNILNTALDADPADFAKVDKLDLRNTGDLSRLDELVKFPELHELNLGSNDLTEVPAVVMKLPELSHLNLMHNKLETVPCGLKKLGKLNVRYNPGIYIPSCVQEDIENLKR